MALTPSMLDPRRKEILEEIKKENDPQKLREQWNIGNDRSMVSAGKTLPKR